jgi:hypothetical protein
MDDKLARYVVIYYPHLMTKSERRARGHLITTIKATRGRSDLNAQAEARNDPDFAPSLSNDPEVLSLAAGGMKAFREATAARILNEHRGEIFLNRCPECGGLARTPKAKQCRFCGYDWHD